MSATSVLKWSLMLLSWPTESAMSPADSMVALWLLRVCACPMAKPFSSTRPPMAIAPSL
jgi:hypothetical protein